MQKLLSFLICLVILAACESPNDNEINEEQSIIDVNLSVSNSVVNVNDSLRFTIKVTNTSSEEVLFYKYKSEFEHLPYISLNITPELYTPSSGVNNYGYGCWIKEDEFASLKPNQQVLLDNNSTELFARYSKCFQTAGTYKVSATVDFDNFGIRNWPKDEAEKARLVEMFSRLPKDSFTSNEIEIIIK